MTTDETRALIAEARAIGNWDVHEKGYEDGPTLFARLVFALEEALQVDISSPVGVERQFRGVPTDEQVELGARGIHELTQADPFEDYHPNHQSELRRLAHAALAAAVAPPAPTGRDCVCFDGTGACERRVGGFMCTRSEGHDGVHVACSEETHDLTGALRRPPAPSADREKLAARLTGDIMDAVPDDNDMQHVLTVAADALATPAPVHIADDAVQKLRGCGLDDTAIRERLAQATMLAAALVPDELVRVIAKIAATAMLSSEDLRQIERAGIRVMLPRGPAPVDEAKLAEVIWEEQESRARDGYVIHTPNTARSTARAVREYLDSLR